MRNFTSPKAIELFKQAQAIEKDATVRAEAGDILPCSYADLMTEAAGLRVLADDIEDGVISEEELEGA